MLQKLVFGTQAKSEQECPPEAEIQWHGDGGGCLRLPLAVTAVLVLPLKMVLVGFTPLWLHSCAVKMTKIVNFI